MVPVGQHLAIVEAEDYRAARVPVTIVATETVELKVRLEPRE